MIRFEEVQAAIAECEGVRRPNANTCLKLAALYTIRDNMQQQRTEPKEPTQSGYSFATIEEDTHGTRYESDTEFGRIVTGKDEDAVFAVFDELLSTLQGMIPRLYAGVIGKLQDID